MFSKIKEVSKEDIKKILQQRLSDNKKLSDIPHPTLLKDSKKAAKKIAKYIKENKKIVVVGDYDVDGVVSTAIVVEFFRKIPYNIEAVIPNRFSDGYGISPTLLDRIDADLIITVDNGISAIEAGEICEQRGIELIITDHHTPSKELPKAYAIVNPKLEDDTYPFKDICGAEVIWLLLGVLKQELNLKIDMSYFIDILSIAIIADIMPLVGINRALVIDGLKRLKTSKRPACIIIRDFINKSKISSEDIAFNIAPKLNSAGRLEDASLALEFLLAKDTYTAYEKFEVLNALNEERKEIEAKTLKEAIEMVDESKDIIVLAKKHWHEGVVGIVASRLVDRFLKPAIVLSINDEGIAKGSARSLGDVNIYELLLKNKEFLEKFGGHKMAAGLSIKSENLKEFEKSINEDASNLPKEYFIPKENIFGILDPKEIDFELLEIIESFEPFGEANIRPKFLTKKAKVIDVKLFGMNNNHSKLILQLNEDKDIFHEFILFKKVFNKNVDNYVTLSYSIVKNEFRDNISMQLLVDKIYKV